MYKKMLTLNDFYIVRDIDGAHIPRDLDNRAYKEASEWLEKEDLSFDDLEVINPITIEDTIKKYSDALESHINLKAAEKKYSSGLSVVSYMDSKNIKWNAEAKAFSAWRDLCWEYAERLLNSVENESLPEPSMKDFIDGLPEIVWL